MTEETILTDDQVCAIILECDPFQSPPSDPFDFDVDWEDDSTPPVTVNARNLRRLLAAAELSAPRAVEVAQ
jgi:hypothetical protein